MVATSQRIVKTYVDVVYEYSDTGELINVIESKPYTEEEFYIVEVNNG